MEKIILEELVRLNNCYGKLVDQLKENYTILHEEIDAQGKMLNEKIDKLEVKISENIEKLEKNDFRIENRLYEIMTYVQVDLDKKDSEIAHIKRRISLN